MALVDMNTSGPRRTMDMNAIVKKLAESGRVWVDWDQRALVILDPEAIYSFKINVTNRRVLFAFKYFVEDITGETLPSGLLGLQFLLSSLITESIGSLPHAPR